MPRSTTTDSRRSGTRRLDEDLRRRAEAQAQALAFLGLQLDRVGRLAARLDRDAAPRHQTTLLQQPQELGALVADAHHPLLLMERAGEQRRARRRRDGALTIGNRIAMRVGRRMAEHVVDALD